MGYTMYAKWKCDWCGVFEDSFFSRYLEEPPVPEDWFEFRKRKAQPNDCILNEDPEVVCGRCIRAVDATIDAIKTKAGHG